MFNLVSDSSADDDGTSPIPAVDADSDYSLALMLEAHRRLCAIDERTHATFRDVVKALEEGAELPWCGDAVVTIRPGR